MAPDLTPSRWKRARPQPSEDASPVPVSSTKKRRLNSRTVSPSKPKGLPVFAPEIGEVLGFGRKGAGQNGSVNGAPKSIYDVPRSSDDEAAVGSSITSLRPAISSAKLGMKPRALEVLQGPKSLTRSGLRKPKNVYDEPDSGDELESPAAVKGSTRSRDITPRKAGKTNGASAKAKAPRSGPATKRRAEAQIADEVEGSEEETPAEGTPSKSSARRQRQSIVDDAEDIGHSRQAEVSESKAAATQRSQGRATKHLEGSARKPAPTPKGILTPRHKKVGRPRKSVAFDNNEDRRPAEVYFEDLPSKSKPALTLGTKKEVAKAQVKKVEVSDQEEGEDDEGEDDEVCVVCSNPDSKRGNQIVFCENCDRAFHQKCYDVPVIPEDDWFCRDCLQEHVLPDSKIVSGEDGADLPPELPNIPNFEHHLQTMQRILVDRCSGIRRIKLTGQSEAYEKAFQLVEQTVLAGEGNSMMIIGARGSGKTTLVETIVSDLASEHKDAFHVVRLNGFIHTDDKLALKEIWRQLGKEMAVEDELVNKTNNYSDTLATLLALLSHPSEITGTEEALTSRSVVFLIDEFDLFATHARQTLLYNLFDIAQARKAPIAVLGLTTRIDVVESLEKRVKSRFSHRYVHLSLPKSIPAYWDICKQGLLVDWNEVEMEGFDNGLEGLEEFLQFWDQKIETLHKTNAFQDHLEYYFHSSKSVSAFLMTWVLPLSALSTSSLVLKAPSPSSNGVSLEAPDSKLHLLTALSDLDLALLIAAARLDIIAHTDTVNFAMTYDEYSSQMGKQRVQSASSGMLALGAGGRVWGRGVAEMAWERLISLGLMIPAGIGGRSNAAHGGLEGKMWKLDVALEEIPTAVELPGFLGKWCSQI